MHHSAQEISYQKLLGQLQDEGNTATIKHYLDIPKGGFLLETLHKYSESPLKQKTSSPKIIPLAPALTHAFTSPADLDSDPEWKGRVFEAAIGSYLLKNYNEVFYWREGNYEVDFVVRTDRELGEWWPVTLREDRSKDPLHTVRSFLVDANRQRT